MMNDNTNTEDSWGQLLSDFGIEDQIQNEPVQSEQIKTIEPDEAVEAVENGSAAAEVIDFDGFGAGLIDSETESVSASVPEETVKTKEKKSVFSRFPKVNFFGAPPQVSLDSVMEGVKSSPLGGKGFTDNKLEKMPLSQERSSRKEEKKEEEPNSWSLVASQIETLASSEETKSKSKNRSVKRQISSMFDDPVPESEESRALRNLMEEPARSEKRSSDAFLETETGSRQRDRGRERDRDRQQTLSPVEERAPRGRGARYKPPVEVDDLPESDFGSFDDEVPVMRERGKRGSRYAGGRNRYERDDEHVRDDAPQEEWSEIDAALQADQERPMHHGNRNQRGRNQGRGIDRDRRFERTERTSRSTFEREPVVDEDNDIVASFESVPNWDDAVGDLISGNISRHRGASGRGRR